MFDAYDADRARGLIITGETMFERAVLAEDDDTFATELHRALVCLAEAQKILRSVKRRQRGR